MRKGHSLVEGLVSLSLFLFVVLASLQFFGFARDSFFKLKKANQARENALSALEKIKMDVVQGGLGLTRPIQMGLLEGIAEDSNMLNILSRDKDFILPEELIPGQTRISLETTKGLAKGRDVCIFDSKKGEIKLISSLDKESVVLASPLSFSFRREESRLVQIKKVSIYFEEKKWVLRRKVNNSPAQPLLEDVASFEIDYGGVISTIHVSLTLKSEKEKKHEIVVFPKNLALAFIPPQ